MLDGGNPTGQAATVANGKVSDGGGANPTTGYSGSVEVCSTIDI